MEYLVRRARPLPSLDGRWDSPAWQEAETAEIAEFRPEGGPHRPRTEVRLLYDDTCIYGIFRVEDRYVRCVQRGYGAPVYKDSCVEIFLQPWQPGQPGAAGYFNFEFSCCGALLASFIKDPERTAGGFKEFTRLTEEELRSVGIYHSLPTEVEPEVAGTVTWFLEFSIPLSLLERYAGPFGALGGRRWRANFYKCGDATSHPHWASWTPLDERNFHLPRCFGTLRFAG